MISHRQRLEACLGGAPIDRPAVALWRHFPVDDQSPEGLAAATLAFQYTYDFDLVKVTPASSYCIKDWGAQDEWRGASEGTRLYTHHVIKDPVAWVRLKALDPYGGYLGKQLACLRKITEALGSDTPVLQTVFSPLAQAKNLVGSDQLLIHLRRDPDALHAGLRTISESTRRFIEAARQTGIAGVFYAVQHAQYSLLSEEEFLAFGKGYDLDVLEPAQELWCNMVHLHGVQVMFDQVIDYPVQIINWHDQDTFPSLKQARARYGGILCGGLQRERSMVLGTPESITTEARQAIQDTNGERFILGTGCVTPITAPYGNLMAARRCVEY
jgi:uroporphyrinogen decarboxylase